METVDTISGGFNKSCKHGRHECPRFDGRDFTGWLMKIEQFFEGEKVDEKEKVRLVMMWLEGRALQWHQHYARTNGGLAALRWTSYLDDMRRRFRDTEFSNPMSDMVALKTWNSGGIL